ncbi:hypothetical protein SAMD00019534_028410 [Acytostelium subglobosum LB1]|uniref:hypothetical protein n=1 Tax=Acytostelium subglobosum LB1 TaxID=1410327 RepID=UPI000644DBB4|nr:hypothetical protein SAMD00019534_028410 [Acytostelium subglobosum LB1]GAM19666.1 hypothetical protein SAMD00019534_028410 [Acytostelium subglobosum LB1]|eukprot:XP_012756428.1 hypothetical protein SAMD00019534_028410 [Acytostelium subglobosum LB1]
MNKAARSVRVSIYNSSSKKLVLKSHPLTSGQWKVPPPDVILPLGTVEFGSESTAILGSTEAGSIYTVDGSSLEFEFFWNNPYFGKRGFRRVAPPNFECDFKVTDQNNCTLRFTIKELDNGMREIEDIEKEIKTLNTLINESDIAIKGMTKMLQVYQTQSDSKQTKLVESTLKEKTRHLDEMKMKRESLQAEIGTIKDQESDPKFMEQTLTKIRDAIDNSVKGRKGMEHMREVYEKQKDTKSLESLDKQIEVKKNETEALRKREQKVIQKIIEWKKAHGIGGTGVVAPAKKKVQALYDYQKTSEDELSIKTGDIIEVIQEDNPEWLGGSVNGQVGYFPRTFVKFIEDAPAPAPAAVEAQVTEQDFAELYPKARVVYAHAAADEGELNLNVGDTIAVYAWDDEYWWEGFVGETSGYFPNNCVEWIEPEADTYDAAADPNAYSFYETSGEVVPEPEPQAPAPVAVAPVQPAPVKVTPTPAPAPAPAKAPTPVAPVQKTAAPAKRELPSAPAVHKPAPTPVAPVHTPAPAPVAPVHTPAPAPVAVAPTPAPAPVAVAPVAPVAQAPVAAVSTPAPSQPDTKKSPALAPHHGSSSSTSSGSFDKLLQPLLAEFTKQLVVAHQQETEALQQRIAALEREVKELKENKPSTPATSSPVATRPTITSTATVISKAAPIVKKL